MTTNAQKWNISLLSGLVFLVVSSPQLYAILERLAQSVNFDISGEMAQMVVTTLIFVLVVRAMM